MKKTWLLIFVLVMAADLTAAIVITSPRATSSYDAGSNLLVSWRTDPAGSPPPSTRLSIWLRTGPALIQIGNNVLLSNGSLNWMIPRTLFGNNLEVSIMRQGTSEVLSTTPGYFTIFPPTRVQVLSPNGGETFRPGGTILVRWRATDIVTEHHQFAGIFLLYYSGGCRITPSNFFHLPSGGSPPAIGSGETGYRLTIPSTAPLSSFYAVQITVQSADYISRGFMVKYDESDGCFTVTR